MSVARARSIAGFVVVSGLLSLGLGCQGTGADEAEDRNGEGGGGHGGGGGDAAGGGGGRAGGAGSGGGSQQGAGGGGSNGTGGLTGSGGAGMGSGGVTGAGGAATGGLGGSAAGGAGGALGGSGGVPGGSGGAGGGGGSGGGGVASTFRCTQLLGGVPTADWFIDGVFDGHVGAGHWELQGSTGINHWRGVDDEVWKSAPTHPCAQGSGSPDRVVLVPWGHNEGDAAYWRQKIEEAITAIRTNRPSAKQIVVQPPVGSPSCTGNYPGKNFNALKSAIAQVVGGDVVAGLTVQFDECNGYKGTSGVLMPEAAKVVAGTLGKHYAP
ncbi:MAG: hypothetical protein KA712_01255 [Myxococcales bacterium]|nr:hypothetical protein [Myxococcales bacterium]